MLPSLAEPHRLDERGRGLLQDLARLRQDLGRRVEVLGGGGLHRAIGRGPRVLLHRCLVRAGPLCRLRHLGHLVGRPAKKKDVGKIRKLFTENLQTGTRNCKF